MSLEKINQGRNIALVMRNNLDLTANGIGGAERSTRNLLGFEGANWLVISPFNLPEDLNHVDSIRTKVITVPDSWHSIPTIRETMRVKEELVRRRPDHIIFSHPGLYNSSIFLALPPYLQKKSVAIWRAIVEPHNDPGISSNRLDYWLTRLNDKLQRKVGNKVRANLAISPAVARSLVRFGISNNIINIPNQVGGEFSSRLRESPDSHVREKYLAPDELGILVVSRILPNKGLKKWIPDFFRELGCLMENLPPDSDFNKVKITVVGEKAPQFQNYYESLMEKVYSAKSEIENRTLDSIAACEFVGHKSKEELEEYYNAYDILLHPSPSEGLSRVSIEAISAGMCIVGNSGCESTFDTIMEPDHQGIKIGLAVESPEKAAAAVFGLMVSRQNLSALQKNALDWSKNFNLEK